MCDGLPDARLCLSGSDVSSLGLAASQGKVNGNACCFSGWSLAVGWQWPFEGSLSAVVATCVSTLIFPWPWRSLGEIKNFAFLQAVGMSVFSKEQNA